MAFVIEEMTAEECFDILHRTREGSLACSCNDRPYVVPIFFACDERKIYGFSVEGKKMDWMRSNPHVCLLVHQRSSPGVWWSVVASGRFEEFPDSRAFHGERNHAWGLLQKHNVWWEPGALKPAGKESDDEKPPIFFGIRVEEISGRRGVDPSVKAKQ